MELEQILKTKEKPLRNRVLGDVWVHWKGYPSEEDSWVPVVDMTHSQRLIKEFHKNHPQAVRSLTMFPMFIYTSHTLARRGIRALRGG